MSSAADVNRAGHSNPLKGSSKERRSKERTRVRQYPNLQVLEKNSPVVYYEND